MGCGRSFGADVRDGWSARRAPAAAPPSDDARQNRQEYHAENRDLDVVADARNVAAQEIADEQHRPNPRQTADDVVNRVATVLHLPHTGHDRHKGEDDGHEARKNDRLSTISLVKRASALEMLAVEV